METSYYDSAEGQVISAARAQQEVAKHGASWAEFLMDTGNAKECPQEFDAQAVLAWLGY